MPTIAIVGASGYSGAELVRILSRHPRVDRLELFASTGGENRRFEQEHPQLRHLFEGPIHTYEADAVRGMDAVFLALPHGTSAQAAEELSGTVGCVIDLSGDLRLQDASEFQAWYGFPHPSLPLAMLAVYGLPELFGDALPGASLISNPGCYPTASALALAPALQAEGLCKSDVVITACSGSSGAGRGAKTHLLLSELQGNAWAYRVGNHQHTPEIQQTLTRVSGRPVKLSFVPQVIPVERGILAVASVALQGSVSTEEVQAIYRQQYESCPFLRLVGSRSPTLREVAYTNFCDIGVVVDANANRLVAVAAIDNLVKGAAGQAVQNWNLAQGQPETLGLLENRHDHATAVTG